MSTKAGGAYIEIRADNSRLKDDLDKSHRQVTTSADSMQSHVSKAFKVIAVAGAASVAAIGYSFAALSKESAILASRFETLEVVMNQVGKNAGYSAAQMSTYDIALRKTGISMVESRNTLIKMTQAQLDLSKATELARMAQDAAVIGNVNSSEAFQKMVYGIQSGQTEVLKSIGINVNFANSYKKVAEETGRAKDSFSESEKAIIRQNTVIEYGARIAGTYEAAMGTAGKKLSSFTRYVEDFKVMMGQAYGPSMVIMIDAATAAMEEMQSEISKPETQRALAAISEELAKIVVSLSDDIPGKVKAIQSSVEGLVGIYQSLPEGVIGAAGAGILGRILTGSTPIGKYIAATVFFVDFITDMIQLQKESAKSAENLSAKQQSQATILNALGKGWGSAAAATEGYAKVMAAVYKDNYDLDYGVVHLHDSVANLGDAIHSIDWEDMSEGSKKSAKDLEDLIKMAKAAKDSLIGIGVDNALNDPFAEMAFGGFDDYEAAYKAVEETYRAQINETADLIYDTYDQEGQAYQELQDKNTKEAKDAAKKIADAQTKAQEKAIAEQERAYKQMMDSIQDYTTDVFYDILDGQIRSWDDMFDVIFDSFKRLLAEMAAAAAMSNIVAPFMASFMGGAGSSGGIMDQLGSAAGNKLLSPLIDKLWSGVSGMFSGSSALPLSYGVEGIYSVAPGIGATAGIGTSGGAASGYSAGSIAGGSGAAPLATATPGLAIAGFAAFAAIIGKKIFDSFTDSNTPYTGLSINAPRRVHDNFEDSSVSDEYGYRVFADDMGINSEVRSGFIEYFDTLFDTLDEITTGSIKDILSDLPSHFESSGGSGADALQNMSDDLFSEMIGDLLLDIMPDVGTTERNVKRLVQREQVRVLTGRDGGGIQEFDGTGMSGRDSFDAHNNYIGGTKSAIVPVYEDFIDEVSILANTFNDQFWAAITPTDGSKWDSFIAFADIVERSTDFLSDFTRQTDEFGESAVNAYLNLQTIDQIMTALGENDDELSELEKALEITNILFADLAKTAKLAHADIEDLNTIEKARIQVIGEQIIGLSDADLKGIITSGGDIADALSKGVKDSMSTDFAQQIKNDFLNPIFEEIGYIFEGKRPDGGSGLKEGGLSDVLDYINSIDFTEVNQSITDFNEALGITDDAISVVTDNLMQLKDAQRILGGATELDLTAEQYGIDNTPNAIQAFLTKFENMDPSKVEEVLTDMGISIPNFINDIFSMRDYVTEEAADRENAFRSIKDAQKEWGGATDIDAIGEKYNIGTDQTSLGAFADTAQSMDPDKIYKILSDMGIGWESFIDDIFTVNESLIEKETELADARANSISSIEDLIKEIEGGSLSPVQSMEYFEQQYANSIGTMNSAITPEELEDATSGLVSSASDYLDFGGDYGGNYQESSGDVLSVLRSAVSQMSSGSQNITINVTANVPFAELTAEAVNNDQETQTAVVRVTEGAV